MDNKGEERDFECKAPANGMLPLSTKRLEGFTCLLDMTTFVKQKSP